MPALCDVEVVSGLRKGVARGILDIDRAELALTQYLELPLTRHGHTALLARMLGLRANMGAYDACYVALAERLGAELLTADEALANAARTHTAIEVVEIH